MKMFDIIQRIGFFRTRAGLSARELSLRIGKHDSYINKLESKDFNLPCQVLIEIIEVLEVSFEEFFSKNYIEYRVNKELVSLVEALPLEKKELLINFLK